MKFVKDVASRSAFSLANLTLDGPTGAIVLKQEVSSKYRDREHFSLSIPIF